MSRILDPVPGGQPCVECTRKAEEIMVNDPVARAIASWADGSMIVVTDCVHDQEARE